MFDSLEEAVIDYSSYPLDPRLNFKVAVEYDALGQIAAAVGFYLRAAEFGEESYPLVAYTALLRISLCIERQGDRNHTAKNTLQQAIAFIPDRPEAYFLLARLYERNKAWEDCYTTAVVGSQFINKKHRPLVYDVEYPGDYGLKFEKAVSAWWIGRRSECRPLFAEVLSDPAVDTPHALSCNNNLRILG